MPDLSALTAIFRRGQYTFTGYISTPPQTVVLAGTVSAVPAYPAKTISYTLDTGVTGDVSQDMTVNFYSATGVKKATLRVASGASVTSVSLPVNEFARGVYDVAVNDTFEVVQAWSIWDRLVSATAALNKDSRVIFTDQGHNPPPVCNSGGAVAGVNTSITFNGSTSFVIDPDSSGSLTHSWQFIDGTPSSSSSATPTVSFPVGFRVVSHTVTDSGNSKSTTQQIPVWVHDDSDPGLAVQMDNLSATVDQGWRCSFRLPVGTEGSLNELPDGALIVYWERERYAGTEASYGSNVSGRSQVKFVGYLVSDSIHIDPDSNEVTFEAISPLAILEQTPALPQLMVSATVPVLWSQLKTLTTKRMLWYISYWHASLQTAFDFVWNDGLEIAFARVAVEGQTIAEQLRDIAGGVNLQVTCDRLGRILFTHDPAFIDPEDRDDRTTTYDLTDADILEIEVTRAHRGISKFVRGEGITSGSAPVFSNAPGNAPASFGVNSDTLAKQIVSSQTDLNNRTGYHFAKVNGLYNGQFVPQSARLHVPDGYDWFDPALREFVTLALAATYNSRAVGWTDDTRWTVEGVDISYDAEGGTKEINVTLAHETSGAPGVTYIPPQESDNGLPYIPPPIVDFPPIITDPGDPGGGGDGGGLTEATKTVAKFSTSNVMELTANFNASEASGGPTWEAVDLTALSGWGGGDLIQVVPDYYSPFYLGTGTEVNVYLITNLVAHKLSDIFGTPTLDTAFEFMDDTTKRTLTSERRDDGFVVVASWYDEDGVYAAVTTNGGTSWSEDEVTAFYNTGLGSLAPGCYALPHTSGKAYISVWTVTDDSGMSIDAEAALYKTLNSGTTWTLLIAPDVDTGTEVSSFIVVPFQNKSATTVYHRKRDVTEGVLLIRNVAGTETDITPEIDDTRFLPIGLYAREAAVPDTDQNTLIAAGVNAGAGGLWDIWEYGTITGNGVYPPGTFINGGLIDVSNLPYIEVQAEATGTVPAYAVTIKTGSSTSCCNIFYETLTGSVLNVAFIACGDAQDTGNWNFAYLQGTEGNALELASSATFTARVSFSDCNDVGGVAYGVFITRNARDAEPTWTAITDEGEQDYREVIALSKTRFILMGVNGAVGMATEDNVDSRVGDSSDTGRICGLIGG